MEQLFTDDVIHWARVYSRKGFWIRVLKPITVELSTGNVITIPAGYVYDGKSAPGRLWGLLPPVGDFDLAVLIHDYIYTERPYNMTLKQADREMLFWSRLTNGNIKWDSWYYDYPTKCTDNYLSYILVKLFGWLVWKKIIKLSRKLKNYVRE